ncbi:MAG: 30S ribosomal protein S12 methylthiotransferase RimO [Neomegalonema sp.]|nr:30S ribosomal protein S12 methylthiotransferase RimO [Neomegalonema sp.]
MPDKTAPRQIQPAPKIGMVSLGCPKALVDSERILSRLRADGYAFSNDYADAAAVIVNTCGFLDSAKAESLAAIGEAIQENGKVIVTGCLGKDAALIREAHPKALAVTGPQATEEVAVAIRAAAPIAPDPFVDLTPAAKAPEDIERVSLTPPHFAYLKIAEGCNQRCSFCVIPSMRGRLASRPAGAVLREAEKLVESGVRELLIVSQDTAAYGVDLKHAESPWRGEPVAARIDDLVRELGKLNAWVRLHYVYPYPHVDRLIPLIAEGAALPYLDIPFQHASPKILKAMRRPGDAEKMLDRIANWRAQAPELALRSTFIVGFPGETDQDFEELMAWLEAAQLDRVGCFKFENVAGAAANDLPDQTPEEVKEERWRRFMEKARELSAARLEARIGTEIDVIVDEVDAEGAECRSYAEAPEIDGSIFIDADFEDLRPGDIVPVKIDEAAEYDLWATRTDS